MVIGNGMIAKAFAHYQNIDNILIFASGVSNSKIKDKNEYFRELNILSRAIEENQNKKLIYFSSCAMFDPDEWNSDYVRHKRTMEVWVNTKCSQSIIFRLPNVVGKSDNQNTIVNFLYTNLKEQKIFDLWVNAYRNVMDIDDVVKTCDYIIQKSKLAVEVINIANPVNYPVADMMIWMEQFFGKKMIYFPIIQGSDFEISIPQFVKEAFKNKKIDFHLDDPEVYFKKILSKYYEKVFA